MSTLSNAYALLIGVGNDLPVTVQDATAVYNILSDETLAGYPSENITLLTEKDATRDRILAAFDTLIKKIDEDSSVLLFYSGHGGLYEPWNQFYLVPNNFDPEEYETTWVKAEELKERIEKINSRRLIFFLDCCHAAGMTKAAPAIKNARAKSQLHKPDGLAQRIDDGKGMSIISSCREDQLSYIMDGDTNSLFTKCLLEVLKGKHKDHFNEEFVRISEVFQYIFKKVPERNPEQRPYANLQIYDDFILSYIPEELRRGVSKPEGTPQTQVQEGGKKEVKTVFRQREGIENAVIFVHGFAGEGAESFGVIPDFLMQDASMENWDLFPLGYSASVKPLLGKGIWASVDDISIIADYLTTSLKYRFGKYQRVALIAHGVGGLVAQKAILNLDSANKERITHLLLFGTPSNGLKSSFLEKLWNQKYRELDASGNFIKQLRKEWDEAFTEPYPFVFKVITATHDEFVPADSSSQPFDKAHHLTVPGSHFSMIKPGSTQNDTYQLILSLLTQDNFVQTQLDPDEEALLTQEYDAVINKLLPRANELDKTGLVQLIFALEGAGRSPEALEILKEQVLAQEDTDLLGILGGRFKRKYLKEYLKADGELAINHYTQALTLAQEKKDCQQIYYHAINLAFLALITNNDMQSMQTYAKVALTACNDDPFDSLWRLATLGEANLYLGNLEEAKGFYTKAAQLAGPRERISIHTNAYTAACRLFSTNNPEHPFIRFLATHFQ